MKIAIIALNYFEPEFAQTIKCIEATGLPVICAERDGVGNYSRAFNEAFKQALDFEYVWMISNIVFDKNVPTRLAESMQRTGYAAIHPSMPSSDHPQQWPDGSNEVKPVDFIEWTAPMVKVSVFKKYPLHNDLAYYYMDLQWCYEVKKEGLLVGVDHAVSVNHVYLRNNKSTHTISLLRKKLRDWWTPISQEHMVKLHGPNWKEIVRWKG